MCDKDSDCKRDEICVKKHGVGVCQKWKINKPSFTIWKWCQFMRLEE
jgi:hypothetical protein